MKKALLTCFATCVVSLTARAEDNPPLTGYFIDSPVSGLYYETSSNLSGTTDKGAFQYNSGDIVSFFIGTDNSGYLLTTLSGQEVITPTLSSTRPSRSINMTRLLLSLDDTPEHRDEIILASKVLSDVEFQKKLKNLDLSYLDAQDLGIDLVSVKEAADHLNQSQEYIKNNFASDEIIFSPKDKVLHNVIIAKKDYAGRACFYDLAHHANPKYKGPIGELSYQITDSELIQFPGTGDYFNGCNLRPYNTPQEIIREPLSVGDGWTGFTSCAQTGCTRHDLSGFSIEDYNDEGDWKYRTVALDFDTETELLMEKTQGLGQKEHIRHANKGEMIWFTYTNERGNKIPYEGIWQHTQYQHADILTECLLVKDQRILLGPTEGESCPTDHQQYTKDVTEKFGDMWWLSNPEPTASLAQMNVGVRWYDSVPQQHFTAWEYLPAGKNWDQGILYRFKQKISLNPDKSHNISTLSVSEFSKVRSNS